VRGDHPQGRVRRWYGDGLGPGDVDAGGAGRGRGARAGGAQVRAVREEAPRLVGAGAHAADRGGEAAVAAPQTPRRVCLDGGNHRHAAALRRVEAAPRRDRVARGRGQGEGGGGGSAGGDPEANGDPAAGGRGQRGEPGGGALGG